jgi:predicted dehydrogenase
MKQIRVGILGASKIAPSALLKPALQRDDMSVRYVASRDFGRATAFAELHGLSAVASYEALIDLADIDLVYVGLPAAGHCEWSIRALEAGKAVLCEKPFALNVAQAQRMVSASRLHGRPLIEAFHYRYHQAMKRAIAIVRGGALGRIRTARAGFCTRIEPAPHELRWSAAQGGGAVMDLGCYPIHALRSLIGEEPTVVSARAVYDHGVDAAAWATLAFPSGTQAEIHCSMTADVRVWDLELEGERGRLALSNFLAPQFGCFMSTQIDAELHSEEIAGPSTYEAQLAHVADVLIRGEQPLTGGDDAIANMCVIDTVLALAAGHRS